jgi:hypothetical protein
MLLALNCHITIGNFEFDYVNQVEIKSSWQNMSDTAMITLPRKLKLKDKSIKDLIKKGDKVSIQLGYNGEFNHEFSGFVSRIEPNVPVVIHCEDQMWKLKQTTFNKSYTSVTLKQLLKDIAPDYSIHAADVDLGPFSIKNVSATIVLQKLKETYGLVSYFRGHELNSGIAYPLNPKQVKYDFQKNIIDNNLEYLTKEDSKIKVTAVSQLGGNKKIEVHLGDADGEHRTLHYYKLTKEELTKRAQSEIGKLKVDGYKGNIVTFGRPYCQHGYVAVFTDNEYPEHAGKYFIDSVETRFGVDGFRRIIKIGGQA